MEGPSRGNMGPADCPPEEMIGGPPGGGTMGRGTTGLPTLGTPTLGGLKAGGPREGGGGTSTFGGDETGIDWSGAPGTALRGRAGASSLLRPSRRPSGVVPIGLAAR